MSHSREVPPPCTVYIRNIVYFVRYTYHSLYHQVFRASNHPRTQVIDYHRSVNVLQGSQASGCLNRYLKYLSHECKSKIIVGLYACVYAVLLLTGTAAFVFASYVLGHALYNKESDSKVPNCYVINFPVSCELAYVFVGSGVICMCLCVLCIFARCLDGKRLEGATNNTEELDLVI